MKKMKFTIEFEVPEDIESFIGVELFLQTLKDGYPWESVMGFACKKMRVRDGKHLHFDGYMCTVKAVGESLPDKPAEDNLQLDKDDGLICPKYTGFNCLPDKPAEEG